MGDFGIPKAYLSSKPKQPLKALQNANPAGGPFRIYERQENNYYKELMTVPDLDTWEDIGPVLRAAGRQLVLVEGTIIDSSVTKE